MSVIRTIMYRAVCDGCGEGDDGEYWAWTDEETARDSWESGDDFVLGDGRMFHRDCLPAEFCPLGDGDELAHTPDEVNHGMCVECEKPIPDKEDDDA